MNVSSSGKAGAGILITTRLLYAILSTIGDRREEILAKRAEKKRLTLACRKA